MERKAIQPTKIFPGAAKQTMNYEHHTQVLDLKRIIGTPTKLYMEDILSDFKLNIRYKINTFNSSKRESAGAGEEIKDKRIKQEKMVKKRDANSLKPRKDSG